MEKKLDYWDWVSTQDQVELGSVETLQTLIKEHFDYIRPSLHKMFWLEANTIYLNQVYNIPQKVIGYYVNMSQLGISKRLHSGLKRLQIYFVKPKESMQQVRDDISSLLSPKELQVTLLYYQFHNLSIVDRIVPYNKKQLIAIINAVIDILKEHEHTHKYAEFLRKLQDYETIGDYIFKKDDGIRDFNGVYGL